MTIWKDLNDPLEIETIRNRLEKLAVEERSLDDFTCQSLQLVGEYIGACSLIVSIRDSEQDCGVIYARQSKQHNSWQFDLGDAGAFNQGSPARHSQAHDFSNPSRLSFCLGLPSRWMGVLQVEYPITDQYSSEHHRTLKSIVTDLSYGLHIALLNQRQINLEDRLQKETRPMPSSRENQYVFTKQILKEMEHSQKMALLGELASGVAHQIRNPLNNLLGALHLIKDNETPEEERQELFDQLTERVETINRMISEFIYYTRITRLNRTPEDINTVLRNSLHSFKSLIDSTNVELVTLFYPQLSVINLDLYLMNQVFHNIIKNALEAMNNNGKLTIIVQKLQIKHGPKPSLEFVEISFEDTGSGIPKEDIKKVLNPFYSKKNNGMGLGLSIVKHVVRAHGGAVRLKSQPGLFTNVTIYLPIR
ncbi:MAG: GHKL domain-containing protein [Deltaproteobacteria bacterium]|uniref:ATP-binding protein n=1 Tax=Desulfobacula sp. TaxID=2593537 RepID=UPI0019B575C1|nr:GHKL domain-containing protein [Candidatus Desulfobacula maris]MBL6995813.1 GHKL domain-containing protein [Desulfobacula sp.]